MAFRFLLVLCVAALAGCSTFSVGDSDGAGKRVAGKVCEFTRDSIPKELSGISRIGGNRYFSVDDSDGTLYELEIDMDASGAIGSCTVKRSVRLEGRVDLEGCACDPLDGRVWVSDESDTTIRQFDPKTGKETARVGIPEVYREHVRPNRSFEGLTLSPDGYRMYVANEDTLTCDGKPANKEGGGVVRIQEFLRTGKNSPWLPTCQFLYRTDSVDGPKYKGIALSGVVGLCAPGDGTLLVLEREMSKKFLLFPFFRIRLYEIVLDVNAAEPGKRLLWEKNTFANYEGICLGPVLEGGSRSLILVSDGGGDADEKILVLSL